MKTKIILGILILFLNFTLFAGVPIPKTHKPSLPYFMEQANFQTILLNVYGQQISGIIPDKYSDLNWNPAFLLQSGENGAYLDFNYQVPSSSNYYNYYHSAGDERVYPNWYNDTHINALQLDPLYNFAFIQKINDRISIGIINRSLFDYGPFRSSSNWNNYYSNDSWGSYDREAYEELELKTVEVAENQQSVWGTQTEFTLGYNLSSKIDIGVKFGHYILRQWGELYDSRYSKQPHSFIDKYNNEDFKINGNQYEFGAGLIYHINDKTNLGFYASIMNGNSTESNISLDYSDNWSERPADTAYYSISKYDLASNYSFSSDGSSPFLSLTFQKELSENLSLRSFFSYRQVTKDISGSIFSTDTMYTDRTYDHYTNNSTYFTRDETSQRGESTLNGEGDEITKHYQWFASLIYKPENEWSAFAAIMLQMQSNDIGLSEISTHYRGYNSQRYYYDTGTRGQFYSYNKNYQYDYNFRQWSAIIPVGIKAHIYGGLSFLAGTDLRFDLIEIKESGDLLYPERINRRTENGVIVVEDIEENRPETYDSDKPKEFNKTSAIHLGAFYEHSSGIKMYVKTEGDIFNKSFWTFGIEYVY